MTDVEDQVEWNKKLSFKIKDKLKSSSGNPVVVGVED